MFIKYATEPVQPRDVTMIDGYRKSTQPYRIKSNIICMRRSFHEYTTLCRQKTGANFEMSCNSESQTRMDELRQQREMDNYIQR